MKNVIKNGHLVKVAYPLSTISSHFGVPFIQEKIQTIDNTFRCDTFQVWTIFVNTIKITSYLDLFYTNLFGIMNA